MKKAALVAQMLIRLCGLGLIILGIAFWGGHALQLIPIHMAIGLVFVLSLWTLAGLGAASGQRPGYVIVIALWGALVLVFGMLQGAMMPGSLHGIIQGLHLLVGLAGMGLAEGLGARIKRAQIPAR